MAENTPLAHRSLLRLLVCVSADDRKSTLLGRLLHATEVPPTAREPEITNGVAHHHFSTERRHFIVAEASGDEHHTRNLVTGASTADCAVIVVDARVGVSRQTRRDSYLVALLGIGSVVVAVDKMETVDYSRERFAEIERAIADVMARIEFAGGTSCIPVSAQRDVNVLERSGHTSWYDGSTLIEHLEGVEVEPSTTEGPLRMPVQWVSPGPSDARSLAGTIAGGTLAPGDEIVALPSGGRGRIERIVGADGDLQRAMAPQPVTLTLAGRIDCSRGDLIARPAHPPTVSDQLQATIVWMHEEPMLRGRNYLMRIGPATVAATVSPLRYKLNVDSLEHVAATRLQLDEIGRCDLELSAPVAFDPYRTNRDTGAFRLVDRITNEAVGAGLIEFALRRAQNLRWQKVIVDREARATALGQTPCVLWLTGLSGAGKSTIANRVEAELHRRGHHTYLLDGDNVRHGLNRDLGFTDADRVENIRRIAEVSKLLLDAGLIVIVSFISPFRSERAMARRLFDARQFLEVFVDTPLAVAEERDTKGLYRKARSGQLANFTGIDSPYEPPEDPEIRLDTTARTVQESVEAVLDALQSRDLISPE
jgi:bifunctional enzyme CysN/CysC